MKAKNKNNKKKDISLTNTVLLNTDISANFLDPGHEIFNNSDSLKKEN